MPLDPFTLVLFPRSAVPGFCAHWPVGSFSTWPLPLPKAPLQISSSGALLHCPESGFCRTPFRVLLPAELGSSFVRTSVSLLPVLSLCLELSHHLTPLATWTHLPGARWNSPMVHSGVISDPSSVDVTQVDSLIGLQAWVSFLGGDPAC